MARKKFVCGNWKMHKTVAEAAALVKELADGLAGDARVQVAVAPAFTALHAVGQALRGGPVELAAQDVHWEVQGAFTGEVSAPMLADVGVRHGIVGHSERRQYFGETDETVNKKIKAALAHNLTPIVCVGESLAQNQAGETEQFVGKQVRGALDGITAEQTGKIVIAYEPIWAIGTGRAATGAMAEEVCALIRQTLGEAFGAEAAAGVRIQYGGSVTATNIAEFISQPDVDGGLVGGASLKPDEFVRIVEVAAKTKGAKRE